MEQFSFYRSDVGGSIILRRRLPSGTIEAEPCAQIWLGENYNGVTYSQMAAVGNGIIEVDDNGVGRIL